MYDKLIPKIIMISISLHLDGTLLLMTMGMTLFKRIYRQSRV